MSQKVVKITASEEAVMKAWNGLPPDARSAILESYSNIAMFVRKEKHKEWIDLDKQTQINIMKRSKVVITV